MARPRAELSAILHDICPNVYFQPPANKKITYPCIIYSLDRIDVTPADNTSYRTMNEYSLKYITRDPDDANIVIIRGLRYCSMEKAYSSDNLHHYPYRIYF